VILLAENTALRRAATTQSTSLPTIPRPQNGVAGKGFNLCAAMELEDPTQYGTVRVSQFLLLFLFLFMNHAQRCVRTLVDRAGLDYMVSWHSQNKELVGKIIGAVSLLIVNLFFLIY
jgi:hypothetical protein